MITERKALRLLSANWRDLVMLNYEVDPGILQSRVPRGTELDTWNGKTFASMVGFRFTQTRLLGLPIPFHCNFDEVNLRFYVRRKTSEGVRRGVVFVKEIVPKPAVAWLARRLYNENYVALPMRHSVHLGRRNSKQATYEWNFEKAWHRIHVQLDGGEYLPAPNSEAQFITEHYWGYTKQPDGSSLEYQVEHPSWKVWNACYAKLECDVSALYGPEFTEYLLVPPSSAFVATGSAVVVRRGRRIA